QGIVGEAGETIGINIRILGAQAIPGFDQGQAWRAAAGIVLLDRVGGEHDGQVVILSIGVYILQVEGVFPVVIGGEFQVKGVVIHQRACAFVASIGGEHMAPLGNVERIIAPGAGNTVSVAITGAPAIGVD